MHKQASPEQVAGAVDMTGGDYECGGCNVPPCLGDMTTREQTLF